MNAVDWALFSAGYAFLTLCLGYWLGGKSGRRDGYNKGYKDALRYTSFKDVQVNADSQ